VKNGNRKDRGPLGGFDFVSILPAILIELNVIEDYKRVTGSHFVKITQPGKIVKLVGSQNHTRKR
jgi:hypothetical protein